jgi:ubiquinone/menaquinone biosynthesis C-methylase UbiE
MAANQAGPLENRIHFFDRQRVVVQDFPAEGYILDVGGGGEGIIGILKGERVVAVDPHKSELEEAPAGPLKIIMDATHLQFLDATFGAATAFFSLMYVRETCDLQKVFGEVFRVLRPGAPFLIWDVLVPKRVDERKDLCGIRLSVQVAGREICTGYGQPWPRQKRTTAFYLDLARKAGFRVVEQKTNRRVLFMRLQKP